MFETLNCLRLHSCRPCTNSMPFPFFSHTSPSRPQRISHFPPLSGSFEKSLSVFSFYGNLDLFPVASWKGCVSGKRACSPNTLKSLRGSSFALPTPLIFPVTDEWRLVISPSPLLRACSGILELFPLFPPMRGKGFLLSLWFFPRRQRGSCP